MMMMRRRTDVTKLTEYVESKEDPLIQIVRTHQHHTNSTLLQTVKNFKKYYQSVTKKIKSVTDQNTKMRKGCMDNFHVA